MRITQIYVKDAVSVSEYAYSEDKNSPARHEMEDNYVAQDNITPDGAGLFAILDGHGGAQVSEYCAKHLPQIFKEQYQKEKTNIKALFATICRRIDLEVADLNASETGSTCCLVLVRKVGDKRIVSIGNLGDTRAIICTDKLIAKRVSIDHKVSNPSEEDRIRSEGGSILKGRVAGQLAITRALGDLDLKTYGVSNIPDFQELQVDQKVLYLVVASDGLWDVCQDQQAVEICREFSHAKQMANALVSHSLNNGTRDNVSVLVLKF